MTAHQGGDSARRGAEQRILLYFSCPKTLRKIVCKERETRRFPPLKSFFTINCYRNYSRIQLLLRDHLIVRDTIHGQDFQALPACTNVLLATAKRSLPDSELGYLGYNDSQKKLDNFSLPFVVRMKPVEIANYYCPEEQTKQGDAGYLCAWGWPEVAGVIGNRWKMYFDSPILWPSPWRLRGVLTGGPAGARAVGVLGRPAAEQPKEGFCSF